MSAYEPMKKGVLPKTMRCIAQDEKGGTAVMFGLALVVFLLFTAFAIDLVTQSMNFEKREATMRQLSQPAALALARLEVRRILNDTAPLTGDLLPTIISTNDAVNGPLLTYMRNRYEQETGKTLAQTRSCMTAFIRRNSNNEMIFQTKLETPKPDAISSAVGIKSRDGACTCSNDLNVSDGCQGQVAGWIVNPSLDQRNDGGSNPGNPVPGTPGTPPTGSVWDVNIQFVVDLGQQQTGAVVTRVGQIVDGFENLMTTLRSRIVINRTEAGANFYQLQATVDDANEGNTGAGAGGGCTYDNTMGWEGCGWSPTEAYNGADGGPGQCVQHRAFPLVAEFLAMHTRYCGGSEAVWTQEPHLNEGGSCYTYNAQHYSGGSYGSANDAQNAANTFCNGGRANCPTTGSPPGMCQCTSGTECTGHETNHSCTGDTSGDGSCSAEETEKNDCSCSDSEGACNQWKINADYYTSANHGFRTMHWFHSCPRNLTSPTTGVVTGGMFRSPMQVMEARAVYKGAFGTTTDVANGPVYPGTITMTSSGFRQDTTDFDGLKDANSIIHMNYACDTSYDVDTGEWGYAYGRETSRNPFSVPGCATSVNSLPGSPHGVNRYTVTFQPAGCNFPTSLEGCDMPLGRYSIELRAVGLNGAMSAGEHDPYYRYFQNTPGPGDNRGCVNCTNNAICTEGGYRPNGAPSSPPVNQWGQLLGGGTNTHTGYYAPSVIHDPIPAEQLYIASLSAESGPRIGGAIQARMYESFASEKGATQVNAMGYNLQHYPVTCINTTNYSNLDYIWYGRDRGAAGTEVNLNSGCAPATAGVAVLNPNFNNQWVPTGVKNTYTEDDTPGETAHYLGCGPGVDTCSVSSNRNYSNAFGIGCSRNILGMRVRNIPFQSLQTTKAAIAVNALTVDKFNGTGSAAMCYAAALGAQKLSTRAGSNVINIFVGMLNCPVNRSDPSLAYRGAIMDMWPQTWQAGLPGAAGSYRLAGYSVPPGELDAETMTCLSQVKAKVEGFGGLTWIYNACPESSDWYAQMREFGSDDGSPGTFPSWTGCNPNEDTARCIFSLWDTIVRDKVMLIDQTSKLVGGGQATDGPGTQQHEGQQPAP